MADNPFPLNQIGQKTQGGVQQRPAAPFGGGAKPPSPSPAGGRPPSMPPGQTPAPGLRSGPFGVQAPSAPPRPATPPMPSVPSQPFSASPRPSPFQSQSPAPAPFLVKPPMPPEPAPRGARTGAPPVNIPTMPVGASPVFPFRGSGGVTGVRTAMSDIKSMRETGGGAPRSYVPPAFPSSDASQGAAVPSVPPAHPAPAAPVGGGTPPPPFPKFPPPPPPTGGSMGAQTTKKGGGKKGTRTLIVVVLSIVLVLGVGAAGYFFLFPMIFGGADSDSPAGASGLTTGVSPQPYVPPAIPSVPSADALPADTGPTGGVDDTGGEVTVPNAGGTSISEILESETLDTTHNSLLTRPANASKEITLSALDSAAFRSALPFTSSPTPILTEINLKTASGKHLTLAELGAALGITVFSDLTKTGELDGDFTLLVYADSKGSWPVYLIKLGSGKGLADAAAKFRIGFEAAAGATGRVNLFLSSPGTGGVWKDGLTDGVAGRYSVFGGVGGMALNYGWKGNVLVIGTSYDGYKEALKRL